MTRRLTTPDLRQHRSARRVLAAGLVAALLVGAVGLAAPGRADRPAASASVDWMLGEFADDHTLQNPLAPVPDWGLMIDTVLAMHAVRRDKDAAAIVKTLDERGKGYWSLGPDGSGGTDGGATAKMAVLGALAGLRYSRDDLPVFKGRVFVNGEFINANLADMLGKPFEVENSNVKNVGLLYDRFQNEDGTSDSFPENAFGQSLAIFALAAEAQTAEESRFFYDAFTSGDAGYPDMTYGEAMVRALLRMQCSEGYFQIYADISGRSCEEMKKDDPRSVAPDGDATAMALSALIVAKRADVATIPGGGPVQDDIDRTVRWILAAQQADGGWGGGVGTEATNTNSTGLIVQALADEAGSKPTAAEAKAIARGRQFLLASQITAARDGRGSLRKEVGAIGYNPSEYAQARRSSALVGGRDRWIRATAQAALGLAGSGFWSIVTRDVSAAQPSLPTPGTDPGVSDDDPDERGSGRAKPRLPDVSDRAGEAAPPRGQRSDPVTPRSAGVDRAADSPRVRLGQYLRGMLADGDHVETTVGRKKYVDYDATADLALALQSTGEQALSRDRATAFLLDRRSLRAYTQGYPYDAADEPGSYATPLAKSIVLGRLAHGLDGADRRRDRVVSQLADRLEDLVDDRRVVDEGSQADDPKDVRRLAWVVLALRSAGRTEVADRLADVLRDARCADGGLPVQLGQVGSGQDGSGQDCTSSAPVTAAASMALDASERPEIRRHVVAGPKGERARVVDDSSFVTGAQPTTDGDDAVDLLAGSLNPAGVMTDRGRVDRLASAQVAGGLTGLGVGTSTSAQTLAAMQGRDGGIAADDTTTLSDLRTTLAAAPVLAGATWAQTPASSVRLPVPALVSQRASQRAVDEAGGLPVAWLVVIGLALAVGGGLAGLALGRRGIRPHHRGES